MRPVSIIRAANADEINTAAAANLKGVTRWSTPVAANSAGLGAALVVQHDLGTVPNMLHVEPYVDSRFWADQDDRRVWDAKTITLHTSHAGVFIVRAGVR